MNINNIYDSANGTAKGGNTYGYIRVSTIAQNDDRQRIAMQDFGVPQECLFIDKQSGKDFDRPAYIDLMNTVKPGDTIVVQSLDRLGRNYDEMLNQWRIITGEKGVAIVVIDIPLLDTRERYGNDLTAKLISNLFIEIFSYVAETERDMNHKRTMEGIIAAQARGVHCGRPELNLPENFETVRARWESGELSEREAATVLGVSRPTFHKWTHE